MDTPLWVQIVSLLKSNRDVGVGDTIKRFLWWIPQCKGCRFRQIRWNTKFNYKNNMEKEFEQGKTVVEIWKTNCQFCDRMKPVFQEISNENKDFTFISIDGSTRTDLLSKYSLTVSPSYLVFNSGVLVGKFQGLTEKDKFIQNIQNPSLPTDKKKYELSNEQVSKILFYINQSRVLGSEAESIVEIKKSLATGVN